MYRAMGTWSEIRALIFMAGQHIIMLYGVLASLDFERAKWTESVQDSLFI